MNRGAVTIFPTQPIQSRPGSGKQYWINVREEYDEEGNLVYRLFNHSAPAGGRLFKGYGTEKKPIRWPFAPGEEWLTHATKDAADTAAGKLQTYLDQIASK